MGNCVNTQNKHTYLVWEYMIIYENQSCPDNVLGLKIWTLKAFTLSDTLLTYDILRIVIYPTDYCVRRAIKWNKCRLRKWLFNEAVAKHVVVNDNTMFINTIFNIEANPDWDVVCET